LYKERAKAKREIIERPRYMEHNFLSCVSFTVGHVSRNFWV